MKQLRKLIDRSIMKASSFGNFIELLEAENIIIEQGNSRKYGIVTKYKFPDEDRFHRGYSLGTFYTDENIRKRISRRLSYLESQKERAKEKIAKKKALYESMTPLEKTLDKNSLKIKSIRDVSTPVTSDNYLLHRWTNVQNARRMQQIEKELMDNYGIRYTDISGHIKSLKATNNYLASSISKNRDEISELRHFIDDCVLYKKLKIYSINEAKAPDKEMYYQEHDTQLNAFHDAEFALKNRNIDLSQINSSSIKILQKRLLQAEQEIRELEDQQRQNEREINELQNYQKEINTYLGRNHEDI